MNLRLDDAEATALRLLLSHRASEIRADARSGFVACHLADRYTRLVNDLTDAPRRRDGAVSWRLDRRDAQSIEALLAHDGSAIFRPILRKINEARLPKADPRRANGRRVAAEAAV